MRRKLGNPDQGFKKLCNLSNFLSQSFPETYVFLKTKQGPITRLVVGWWEHAQHAVDGVQRGQPVQETGL